MTVLEVIQRSAEFLARKGVESPRLQVELLLAHLLKVPRLRLYLDFERQLTEVELESIRQLVKRRAAREPLQHLVGSVCFCGLELRVTGDVLIPRPETEVLAEHVWKSLEQRVQEGVAQPLVLDVGTGSGCLALAILHHVPAARAWAVDISSAALEVARVNAAATHLTERLELRESDLFGGLPAGLRFDLVVSNPPYIASGEIRTLAPEVREHDPRLALDGGADGLDMFRRLAAEVPPWLKPDGWFLCEFGDGQAEALSALFEHRGWRTKWIVPDLSGRPRILIARRPES